MRRKERAATLPTVHQHPAIATCRKVFLNWLFLLIPCFYSWCRKSFCPFSGHLRFLSDTFLSLIPIINLYSHLKIIHPSSGSLGSLLSFWFYLEYSFRPLPLHSHTTLQKPQNHSALIPEATFPSLQFRELSKKIFQNA